MKLVPTVSLLLVINIRQIYCGEMACFVEHEKFVIIIIIQSLHKTHAAAIIVTSHIVITTANALT